MGHAATRWRAGGVVALFALAVACASASLPPGGPVDRTPLVLVRVTPDTGALNVRTREVLFRFNKVVSEPPSLDQLVVVSPSDGLVNVDWRREVIAVRPRKGWRPNTTYSVTILPALTDLQRNPLKNPVHTEFATGAAVAHGVIRGVAFDWVAQQVTRGARVEATTGTDTMFRYLAAADEAGRFALTSLPPGEWRVRVYKDDNSNRVMDRRELFDSITLTVPDSARHDFYLFLHDSLPPRTTNVTAPDSQTVRVAFDKPLSPGAPLDSSHFAVTRQKDSSRVAIRRVVAANLYDSLTAARKKAEQDSIARADTSLAARRTRARNDSLRAVRLADSLSAAQVAALKAARDTVKRDSIPKPARAAPVTAYVLELDSALVSKEPMRLEVRDVTSLSGNAGTFSTGFRWTRAPPPPSKDSAGPKLPAQKP
jgi:hypothetical protein